MDTSLEDWARYTPRERMQRYAIFLFAVITIVWALTSIDVIWPWVFDAPQQMGDLFSRMVPPDVTNLPSILWVLVETVNIATIATAIAVFVSLPVAYIAAQ
ncbi:MAG: phosphonate ABC transporter, permease protein PhnE, partial [Nitratireductor rhodophyticola]